MDRVALVALSVGYAVWCSSWLIFNRLGIVEAWSDIEVQLKRNLVFALRSYRTQERGTLHSLTEQRYLVQRDEQAGAMPRGLSEAGRVMPAIRFSSPPRPTRS